MPVSARVNVLFPTPQGPESRSKAVPLGGTRANAAADKPPPPTLRLVKVTEMAETVPGTPLTAIVEPAEALRVELSVMPLPVHVVTLPLVEQLACACDGSKRVPTVKTSRPKDRRMNRAGDTQRTRDDMQGTSTSGEFGTLEWRS